MTSCRREADHDDARPDAVRKNRAVRRSLIGLSTLALTVATFLPGQMSATAAPTAVTVAEAKAQIEQLEVEAEALDQEYVGVKEQLDRGRAKLQRKQEDVKEQTEKVADIKLQVGQVAEHFSLGIVVTSHHNVAVGSRLAAVVQVADGISSCIPHPGDRSTVIRSGDWANGNNGCI